MKRLIVFFPFYNGPLSSLIPLWLPSQFFDSLKICPGAHNSHSELDLSTLSHGHPISPTEAWNVTAVGTRDIVKT